MEEEIKVFYFLLKRSQGWLVRQKILVNRQAPVLQPSPDTSVHPWWWEEGGFGARCLPASAALSACHTADLHSTGRDQGSRLLGFTLT